MTLNDMPDINIERMRKRFTNELEEFYKERFSKPKWDSKRIADVMHIIEEYEEVTTVRDPTHYYYNNNYVVKELNGQKVLASRRNNHSNKIIKIVPSEDYFDILLNSHLSTGHGGRDKMNVQLKDQFYIPSSIIAMFPKHCLQCQSKRFKNRITQPAAACDYKRGILHIIDMTKIPDNTNETAVYNYIMYYQDQITNFVYLRALTHYSAIDTALELFRIFAEMGGPGIINSTIEGGFTEDVINSLDKLYPGLILIGKPIQPGERDECEEEVKSNLLRWMTEKNSSTWSIGIHIVASNLNNRFNEKLERSPYRAMFGVARKQGIDVTTLPNKVVETLHTEDDLDKWLDSQAQLKLSRKRNLRNTNRQCVSKKTRVSEQKPVEEKETSTTDKSIEIEKVWCWVCEKDDKLVICRCNSCDGSIHECCGRYKDESKTILECNLCFNEEKDAARDGKTEIKVEVADVVEVTETKIG